MNITFCIPSYMPKEYRQLMKYVTKDTDLRRYEGLSFGICLCICVAYANLKTAVIMKHMVRIYLKQKLGPQICCSYFVVL